MKKKLILIVCLLLLSGCGKNPKIVKKTDDLVQTMNSVEVYSDVYLKDLFYKNNENLKLLSENYKIDTDKLGKKEYSVEYKINRKKYIYKFNINVIDTEAPIIFGSTNKTVYKNHDGDICDLIAYGDNYDRELKCEIEGNYDFKKIGTYKFKYLISDKSDNKKEADATLRVIEKKNYSGNNSNSANIETKKTEFTDIIKKYKNDKNEIGIDVSKWQEEIDFEKVKAAGAEFVIIRIGVQRGVKKDIEIDEFYYQNIENAKKAGLKVGVYLYSVATSREKGIEHANWVINTLNKEKLDLPIIFDWENWIYWNEYNISFHDLNEAADGFMETIKNSGYSAMLYSSKYYLEKIWDNKNEYPVWLAHYVEKSNYKGKYNIWQLCDNGHIDGIEKEVDVDILYK